MRDGGDEISYSICLRGRWDERRGLFEVVARGEGEGGVTDAAVI